MTYNTHIDIPVIISSNDRKLDGRCVYQLRPKINIRLRVDARFRNATSITPIFNAVYVRLPSSTCSRIPSANLARVYPLRARGNYNSISVRSRALPRAYICIRAYARLLSLRQIIIRARVRICMGPAIDFYSGAVRGYR